MALTGGSSAVSPRKLARILRQSTTGRIATVYENDDNGNVCRRALTVEDIESRTDSPKEVIDLNEEETERVLRILEIYKYTGIYMAVMVTVVFIILILQIAF